MGKVIQTTDDIECVFCGFDAARGTGGWWVQSQSLEEPSEYEPTDDVLLYCPQCGWDDEYSGTKTLLGPGDLPEKYCHWLICNEQWVPAARVADHCNLILEPYDKFSADKTPTLLSTLSHRVVMRIKTTIKSIERNEKSNECAVAI